MEFLFVLLSLIASSSAVFDYNTRCLLFLNQCVNACPRLMHAYHTRCDGDTWSQVTCYSPAQFLLGFTCGWSRCDCNIPLVLNEEDGLCVPLNECPPTLPRKHKLRRKPGIKGPTRRVKINEEDPVGRVMDGE